MILKSKYRVFLAFFLILGLLAPVLVQADVFLRPSTDANEETEKPKKSRSFLFLSPPDSATDNRYRPKTFFKRKTATVTRRTPERFAKIDPDLLTSKGSGPKTVKELQAVAAAHKAPKFAALMKFDQRNDVRVARKMLYAQQNEALQRARKASGQVPVGSAAKASESSKAVKTRASKKSGFTLKKPKKVFLDSR